MVTRLRLTWKVLTPLYLGGADQEAELRPPSFKGLFRYWYRAINPTGFHETEAKIFGGAGERQGQAPFSLCIDRPLKGEGHWDEDLAKKFNTYDRDKNLPQNGLRYLGYPFPLNDDDRKKKGGTPRTCIQPATHFDLTCVFPRQPGPEIRRGLAASIWLLGHVGGAGSRSRRGFGALALTDWGIVAEEPRKQLSQMPPDEEEREGEESKEPRAQWKELDHLPLLHGMSSPEMWRAEFNKTLTLLKEDWFKKTEEPRRSKLEDPEFRHPHFGDAHSLVVGHEAHTETEWASCLNDMGLAMQRFRQKLRPDYDLVKPHFEGKGLLGRTPDRASFGLPLTFRFRSVEGKPVALVSGQGDRHGSLLHLRPALINDKLYPLYLRLAGDVPGQTPGARIQKGDNLDPINKNAMDEFMETLSATREE